MLRSEYRWNALNADWTISGEAAYNFTDATGMFRDYEIQALREVLDDYFSTNHAYGHRCDVWQAAGEPLLGYAYFAPAAMTDGELVGRIDTKRLDRLVDAMGAQVVEDAAGVRRVRALLPARLDLRPPALVPRLEPQHAAQLAAGRSNIA